MGLAKSALERDAWKLFEATEGQGADGAAPDLALILERCVAWFGATGASVFLREGSSRRFRLAAQAGSDSNIPAGATLRAGSGIAGLSIESGEPLLIADPLHHPLLQGRVNTHQVSLGSSIVMPLIAPNEGCIGVVNLSRMAGGDDFDEGDLARVGALARQLSLAVSNARLFDSLASARHAEAQARGKLECVVQSLGVAVLVFDAKGRITEANPKARAMLGGGPWQSALDAISPTITTALVEALTQARSRGYVQLRACDEALDRTWTIVCTPLDGEVGGAAVVLEETTAQERDHREMARLARLAEIGQMTAAIAHEIRNPLTGIRSAAQMIAQAPEHAIEFAGIVDDEVGKLNSLCDQFLEFARPLALRRRELPLDSLARGVIDRLSEEFRAAGVHLDLEIEGERPTIYADALRLEQVIRNLLLNALQACRRGDRVQLFVRPEGFRVADTGKGMRDEEISKLFTPFFTTKPQGTGLGLPNVRKIVDAHGGKIGVWSQPGAGAHFDVAIPEPR